MRALAALLVALVALPASGQDLWSDLPASALRTDRVLPTSFRALALDRAGMDARLATVPLEARPGSLAGAVEVPIPLPDGEMAAVRLVESPIMEPGLQARYPQLRTYTGVLADDPTTTVRVSVTPAGVGAWIMAPSGISVLDPVGQGTHMAYRRDAARAPEGWAEARAAEIVDYGPETRDVDHDHDHDHAPEASGAEARSVVADHGETLRLYRLAVGTTGEYTQFHGGTVESAMAAIMVAMNRVNGLYERDVAVRMLLVDENEKVVFTDPFTDPYTDGSPFSLFNENQAVIDDSIGTDNYDIGHVFSTGGGGVAGFGVVCRTGRKAQGVTGLPSPIGDPFYVDYVAHEIGHQFRASHTFNGNSG
ncbi:MAG: zinc-dependent metalloprotease family protein, partial [Bacteroidota bacterium]